MAGISCLFQGHPPVKNQMSTVHLYGIATVIICLVLRNANGQQNTSLNKTSDSLTVIVSSMRDGANKQQVIDALQQISQGSEQFSVEFFMRLSRAVTAFDYDFIVSPFSIWSLLVLQAEGADGNTLSQLQRVLRLPVDLKYLRLAYPYIQKTLNVNTTTVEVAVNQGLFSDENRPIDIEYAYKLDQIYQADHISVNFHNSIDALNKINQYVSEQTRGKISRIVNLDDLREAQMILISALFFKGQWKGNSYAFAGCTKMVQQVDTYLRMRTIDMRTDNEQFSLNIKELIQFCEKRLEHPFNISFTTEEAFYDEFDNFKGNVNMMFQRGPFSYTGIVELDSHVIELPYGKEDRLSMIIILPQRRIQLTSVIERLATFGIGRILNELRRADADYEEDEIEVFIPRFSITADFTLNVILEQMGLTDIFDVNKANLSKISKHSIYLSRIIHKAKIDVNEVGTVASAATGAIFANKAISPRFHANRPFAYLLIEKITNTLLFCGQVRNPGKVDFKEL